MAGGFDRKSFVYLLGAFILLCATATFCGCSSLPSQLTFGPTSGEFASKAWRSNQPFTTLQHDATNGTLYASSTANTVTEYDLRNGTVIGTLGAASGINSGPSGMFFSKGHLYVTNGNQVLVFPAGQTTASLTLEDPIEGPFASDVVVGTDGTVYLANFEVNYSSEGNVEVFERGKTAPEYSINFPSTDPVNAVTLDSSNNLYVGYSDEHGPKARIAEYPPGSRKGQDTGWSLKSEIPGGMAFDKSGNLVVIDGAAIDVFTPGTSKPARTFGSLQQPQFLVFDKAQTVLYVTNYGANQIDEFDYSTGELINTISLTGPIGLAINP